MLLIYEVELNYFLGKVGRHKIYVFMERNVYKRLNIFKVDFIVRFDVNKLREAVMDCVKEVEDKLNLLLFHSVL